MSAAVAPRSLYEATTGTQTQSVPPSSKCGPQDPVVRDDIAQALLRSGYANKAALPRMITFIQLLAFVTNLHDSEFLLDSGTLDFMVVSRVAGDGGRSYNETLAIAPPPVARRPPPTTRPGTRMSHYRAGTPSRGGSPQRRAVVWM